MSKKTSKKEEIEEAAYYISQKKYSYDELCYMLAEKLMIGDRLGPGTSEDALKFFINWLLEMVDVGGPNLPKTISSRLGAKLGQVYKNRGIDSIEEGLKSSYEAIQGDTEVIRKDENTVEVKTNYVNHFCPIGGSPKPEKAKVIQDSICTPFTVSFLTQLDPNYSYEGHIHACIVESGGELCDFTITIEKKNNNSH